MTETSPLASVAWPKHAMHGWDDERLTSGVRTKAGLPPPGVAVGSPDGYFVIADRSKDLIKSGGEWISSLEADIMAMPQVAEAAVVAMPDPRWQERPLAFVVASGTDLVTLSAVRGHLESLGWAKWQLPDRVEHIDRIPVTSTGKFDKKQLRARLARLNPEGRGTEGSLGEPGW
jgi:fatty-acyl-CoA synthase